MSPAKSNWTGAASLADGRAAIFYSASGRPILVRLNQMAPGKYFGWWFNPRSGGWHASQTETPEPKSFARDIAAGPAALVRDFTPPSKGDGNDWVLILADRDRL